MNTILYKTLFLHEWKQFVRNRAQVLTLLVFFLLGIYGIHYGHSEMAEQEIKITSATDSIVHAQRSFVNLWHTDTTTKEGRYQYETVAMPSLARFNYNFVAANRPTELSSLTIGQRDLFPVYYRLNAQSFYIQTLKGGIYNPFKLYNGNFDLTFVILYLLPLLIIANGFDILSSEKDLGVLPLLQTFPVSVAWLIRVRSLFRYFLSSSVLLILWIIGIVVLYHGQESGSFPYACLWLLVALVYSLFWQSFIYFIASLKLSTPVNAIVSISIWIFLLLLLPALGNLVFSGKKGATDLADLMRSKNMPETDSAMEDALQRFYVLYPNLQPKDTSKSPFYYFQGYSAFLYLTDLRSDSVMRNYYSRIDRQNKKIRIYNSLNAAVTANDLFQELAVSGSSGEMVFLKALRDFHKEKIFWFTNKPLFANHYMQESDYLHAPVFAYTPNIDLRSIWWKLCVLLGETFVLIWSGHYFFRRNKELL